MKEMFDFSLKRTYELLQEQLMQARRTGKVQVKVRMFGIVEMPATIRSSTAYSIILRLTP